MIELVSLRWAAVALAAVVGARVLRLGGRARLVLFVLATVALFVPGEKEARRALVALGAVTAYGFASLHLWRSPRALFLHVPVLFGLLFASQHGQELARGSERWLSIVPLVGLPYVTLRAVHVLVDVRLGRTPAPTPLEYAAYLVPFHQLVAGPIERLGAFREKLAAPAPPLRADETLRGLSRIADGLVKKLVLAVMLQRIAGGPVPGAPGAIDGFELAREGLPLWLEVDLQALYVWLDFSGYMDVVIGVGILCGWVPPENFDRPYLARNLVVFWTRWHATLGTWIRDYVFVPVNLALQRARRAPSPLVCGIAGYFAAMVFCGLWHRSDAQFVLWGALHGAAIAVFKLFEAAMKRTLAPATLKSWRASRVAGAASAFLTFQFVAVSFVFAFRPAGEALDVVRRLVP